MRPSFALLKLATAIAGLEARLHLWRLRRRPTASRLRYAAHARCPCGAGLAYDPATAGVHGFWDCSDIILGKAIPEGQPGAKRHSAPLPFAFYEIKSEDQPSAHGATTRPRA